MWENILTTEVIIFLIITISGIILFVVILATETDLDDYLFLPILGGLVTFGIIGTISSLLLHDITITIILAVISWIITSIIAYYTRSYFESKPTDYKSFEGGEATVEIPFSKTQMGRITIISKSGDHSEFPARAEDPNDPLPYQQGDKVIIKRLDGMVAEVAKIVDWEIKKLKKGVN